LVRASWIGAFRWDRTVRDPKFTTTSDMAFTLSWFDPKP
jgi:hypothetical protein